jgi:hypothetical protein
MFAILIVVWLCRFALRRFCHPMYARCYYSKHQRRKVVHFSIMNDQTPRRKASMSTLSDSLLNSSSISSSAGAAFADASGAAAAPAALRDAATENDDSEGTLPHSIRFGYCCGRRLSLSTALTKLIMFTYITVVSTTLQLVRCVPLRGVSSDRYVFKAATVSCYSAWQYGLLIFLAGLLCWPFALTYIVRHIPELSTGVLSARRLELTDFISREIKRNSSCVSMNGKLVASPVVEKKKKQSSKQNKEEEKTQQQDSDDVDDDDVDFGDLDDLALGSLPASDEPLAAPPYPPTVPAAAAARSMFSSHHAYNSYEPEPFNRVFRRVLRSPYNERTFFWEAIQVSMLIGLAFMRVFMTTPVDRIVGPTVLLVFFLCLTIFVKPYKTTEMNIVAGINLLALTSIAVLNVPDGVQSQLSTQDILSRRAADFFYRLLFFVPLVMLCSLQTVYRLRKCRARREHKARRQQQQLKLQQQQQQQQQQDLHLHVDDPVLEDLSALPSRSRR